MTPLRDPDANDLEHDLAERLAAFDEPGQNERRRDQVAEGLDAASLERLERALDMAKWLRRFWHPAAAAVAGTTFGRFELIRELGRGGHGVVFLAFDPTLKRDVAVKIPRPEALDSPDLRKRFLREARAAASLDHPGIVPAFEMGEVGPVCYIASAYVDGPTLEEWLAGLAEPPTAKLAAQLMATIADAIEYAHARGVLHRDLKPSNILLELPRNGAESGTGVPHPRVADFGLAKWIFPGRETTTIGALVGTPRYIAPEQLGGGRHSAGPRADVYSLGVILTDILVAAERSEETGTAIIKGPPADLAAIARKCLEPDPADRYGSAADFAADLRRFLGGVPTLAGRSSLARRAWRFARRHPESCVAFAAVLVAAGLIASRIGRESRAIAKSRIEQSRLEREAANERYVNAVQAASELLRRFRVDLAWQALDAVSLPAQGETNDPRGFEWGYLRGLFDGEPRTLRGHAARGQARDVLHVEFAPDGKILASSGRDGTVRLWDAASGVELRRIKVDKGDVNWVTFSPDGKTLATAADATPILIWDTATGEAVKTLSGHSDYVVALAYSPDGRHLFSGSHDGRLFTWDLSTGRVIHDEPTQVGAVDSMALSADGRFLAVGGNGVAVWERVGASVDESTIQGQGPKLVFRRHLVRSGEPKSHVLGVAISNDGRFIAAGGEESGATLFESSTGQILDKQRAEFEAIDGVALSRDGTVLASGGGDGNICLWDLPNRAIRGLLRGHEQKVWCVSYSPDQKTLASCGADGTVRLWNLARFDRIAHLSGPPATSLLMEFDPDGTSLTVVSQNGAVRVLDTRSGAIQFDWPAPSPKESRCFVLSRDGRSLLYEEKPGRLTLVGLDGQRPRRAIDGLPGHDPLGWLDNRSFFTILDDPHVISQRDLATGRVIREERLDRNERVTAVSLDGRQLLIHESSEGKDWRCRIENLSADPARPRMVSQIDLLNPHVHVAAFSPDGRLAAFAGDGGVVELWQTETLERTAVLSALDKRGTIRALVFSVDGRTIATGDEQGIITLWNVTTRRELLTLANVGTAVSSLRFAPDGRSLAAGIAAPIPGQASHVTIWHALH